ncbi:MAG: hypothetical protein JF590_03260 [Gemmatimonadetes bacterium]|nr:hypothetical protein [Gemmatimonadota bacterium]
MIRGLLLVLAGVAQQATPADSFRVAQVGEVRAVATSRRLDAAIGMAELADRPTTWPGLGRRSPGPLQLVLVADSAEMSRLSHGRAPGWGAAVAFPESRTIILRADLPDLPRTLRHEVAHLVLGGKVRSRLPLWFDEGYAVLAAGEWDRLTALEVHLSVLATGVPTLGDLDGQLRAAAPTADRAYGLAESAVTALAERMPGGDLAPLLDSLARGVEFADAVHAVTGRELSRFESEWQQETRKRFRGVLWFIAGGWWSLVGVAVVVAWWLRRRRDRPRRIALDTGWELPPEEGGVPERGEGSPPPIDQGPQGV